MNDMPDGNTAALNEYLHQQEILDKAAEIEADEREMEILNYVIDDIECNGEASKEAIGTQATLTVLDQEHGWQLGIELKECLAKAISNPSYKNDQELGKCIREMSFDYIAKSMEDLI